MAAISADVGAHILNHAEDRDADLLKHLQALAGVEQGDVLRCGDDDGAGDRHLLRQRQLDIAGAGRHVDDQVIEVTPVGLFQQLRQRLRHDRAAPHHRFVGVDHETDRRDLQAVVFQRLHGLAVDCLGAARDAHHHRL